MKVQKHVEKDIYLSINKEDTPVKDGVLQSKLSKSKRRRARKKNKLATIQPVTEQVSEITIKTNSYEQCKKTINSQSNEELYTSLTNSNNHLIVESNIEVLNSSVNLSPEMENTNSENRSDILAKRQDKKSAKMKTKNKSNSKGNNNQKLPSKEKLVTEKCIDTPQSTKVENKVPDGSAHETECKKPEPTTLSSADERTQENTIIKTIDTVEMKKANEITKKTEKTREEIMAEREAKKLAKQNAKLKGKGNPVCNKSAIAIDENSLKATEIQEANIKTDERSLIPEKSKAELRAERRAKQEAQRALKDAEKRSKLEQQEKNEPLQVEKIIEIKAELKPQKEKVSVTPTKVGHQKVKLFSHLKFEQKSSEAQLIQNIHPEVLQLGIKYSSRVVMGSNARCVALLKALKGVIMDYITPSEKEFSRGLESQLTSVMTYLNKCRPSSVSMINALRHIKSHLTQLPNDITDVEARRKLCDVIDTYIREQIDVAGEAICNAVQKKIANGDNILIYACSSLLYRILVESHKSGKQFTVVVVDSGPWFEGREMLRRLVDHGIKCSYVLVSALSFIMREVTKVLLGAHALLANGSVMSRAGSALVALVANSYNVPVLVCCETYKFCERVQMDAFVYNELGNDEDMEFSRTEEMKENETVTPLSVLYDITPADLVTAVVTELAILPCTSVPVILRIKPSDVVS